MFGISATEIMLILGVALVIFGPQKLPEIASSIGRVVGQLKKQSDELRREFYNSVYTPSQDFRNSLNETERKLKSELLNIEKSDKDTEK